MIEVSELQGQGVHLIRLSVLLAFLSFGFSADANEGSKPNQIRDIGFPFGTVKVEQFEEPLDSSIRKSGAATLAMTGKIIGLGEGSHGTKQFGDLRTALIDSLIGKKALSTVALEASYGDCFAANDFVKNGRGDPVEAVAAIRNWPWQTEEMASLLRIMRQANQRATSAEESVTFECFDVQQIKGALLFLKSNFGASLSYKSVAKAVDRMIAFSDTDGYFKQWSQDQIRDAEAIAQFAQTRTPPPAFSTDLSLLADSIRFASRVWSKEDIFEQVTMRDELMAELLNSLLARGGARSVAIWAHNGHIMRYQQEIRPGLVYKTLGQRLADKHGSAFIPIAFIFDRGAFRAVPNSGPPAKEWSVGAMKPGTLTGVLISKGVTNGFVDLRSAHNEPLFRGQKVSYRQIEAVFDPSAEEQTVATEAISELFDGIVFIRESQPSVPIRGKQ